MTGWPSSTLTATCAPQRTPAQKSGGGSAKLAGNPGRGQGAAWNEGLTAHLCLGSKHTKCPSIPPLGQQPPINPYLTL